MMQVGNFKNVKRFPHLVLVVHQYWNDHRGDEVSSPDLVHSYYIDHPSVLKSDDADLAVMCLDPKSCLLYHPLDLTRKHNKIQLSCQQQTTPLCQQGIKWHSLPHKKYMHIIFRDQRSHIHVTCISIQHGIKEVKWSASENNGRLKLHSFQQSSQSESFHLEDTCNSVPLQL